jgi:hypothetical protein
LFAMAAIVVYMIFAIKQIMASFKRCSPCELVHLFLSLWVCSVLPVCSPLIYTEIYCVLTMFWMLWIVLILHTFVFVNSHKRPQQQALHGLMVSRSLYLIVHMKLNDIK